MSRFAVFCTEGTSLALQRRLLDEGNEVMVYQNTPDYRKVGVGIVPLAPSRDAWLDWGLADRNTVFFFDCTSVARFDHGALADRLRNGGRLVVGAGTLCDRLENDRTFGATFAETCGITAPPAHEFSSVSAAVAFVRRNPPQQFGDGGWAWKSDRLLGQHGTFVGDPERVALYLEQMVIPAHGDRIKCILQERIPGAAISTARWWNGSSFTGPFEGTIEHKAFMDGEVGPSTGCAMNVLWYYRETMPKIGRALCFDALEAELRGRNAPPGIYDVNAVVDRRAAWFLEWTPRLGYDSELTGQRGISNYGEMLRRLATGRDIDDLFDLDQLYMSVRLSVPPYPLGKVDLEKSPALGVPISGADGLWQKFFVGVGLGISDHGLQVNDPYGFAGLAVTADTSLERGYERIAKYLDKDLCVPDLQYRTDAAKTLAKDVASLAKAGYYTTDALDEDEEEAA